MAIREDLIQSRSLYVGTSTNLAPSTSNLIVDGLIGVGTTNPGERVSISGNVGFQYFGTQKYHVGYYSGGLNFAETNIADARLFIKDGGNVGIGTLNPDAKLSIVGTTKITDGTNYLLMGQWDGSTNRVEFVNRPLRFAGYYGNSDIIFANNSDQERMRISSTGNVGIGTSTPNTKLDVNGDAYFRSDIRLGYNYSGPSTAIFKWQGGSSDSLGIFTWGDARNIQIGGSNTIFAAEGGSERMRITTAGNVGIGTSSPGSRLEIAGALGATVGIGGSTLRLVNTDTGNTASITAGITGMTNAGMQFSTDGTVRMIIASDGNVGIGTSDPATYPYGGKLNVNGSISSSGGKIGFGVTDAFTAYGYSAAHYGLSYSLGSVNPVTLSGYYGIGFFTTGSEKMRIAENGNVGIGTTIPDIFSRYYDKILGINSASGIAKIEINGSSYSGIDLGQGGVRTAEINGTSSALEIGTIGSIPLYLYTNGSFRVGITSGGNVGIGTTNPIHKLSVDGNISIIGGSSYLDFANGDVRLSNSAGVFTINTYSVSTGLSEKVRVTGTGNVGIGTTAPSTKLDVNGYITTSDGNLELYKSYTVDMSNTGTYSTSNYYPVIIPIGTEPVLIQVQNNLNSNVPSWSTHPSGFTLNVRWITNGSGWGTTQVKRKVQQYFENWASTTICGGITQMTQSSTEVIWLRGGGTYFFKLSRNFTPSPQASTYTSNGQSVSPSSTAQNTVWNAASGSETYYAGDIYASTFFDADNTAYYLDPSNVSNLYTSYFGGVVGIGTTYTYGNKLTVNGGISGTPSWNNATLELRSDSGLTTALAFHRAGYTVSTIYSDNGSIVFGESGGERMRISGGNVGIGTSAPTEKLEVNGNINISPASFIPGFLSFYNDLAGQLPFITNYSGVRWGYKNGDPGFPSEATDMSIINNYSMAGYFGSIMSFKIQPYVVPSPSFTDTQVDKLNLVPYNFFTGTGGVGINTTNPQASLHVYENGGLPPFYRNDFRAAKFEWDFGGVVFPNVPEDNRNMIPGEPGMVIFNTTVRKLQVFDGANWINLH